MDNFNYLIFNLMIISFNVIIVQFNAVFVILFNHNVSFAIIQD